jgi:hypothetical protein
MTKNHLSRKFLDKNLIEWEAYVTGGQPDTVKAACISFVCLNDPFERPRWVGHESRDVAEAHRDLARLTDAELVDLLDGAAPLD